ncbi:MAG: FkbM family methyltransferase [Alphaproteobacteria bacterium]|nr:FkbM family methyltransferase [Alphaproteobacteria bacterium]
MTATDTKNSYGRYALKPTAQRILKTAQRMPVSWAGRRGALILRKIVLLSGVGVVDAPVDGLNLRLYMQDNVSERKFLFMPQFFDRFERDLLKEKLQDGDTFIDIGANAGIYTMTAAAAVGDTGRVISIEPNPAVLERLIFNAKLNGFENRITTVQAGVSDTKGTFDLTLDTTNLGGSSLVAARSDKTISVSCYPLLDILNDANVTTIRALKIDIEGAEDKALIPFFASAPKALLPQYIILENSNNQWQADLPASLQNAGYARLQKTRMNTVWHLTQKEDKA